MEINKIKSVLKAWLLLESLAPSEVPGKGDIKGNYFKDNQNRDKTRLIKFHESPWEKDQLKDKNKYQVQYQYYLSCFDYHKLVRFLRENFKNKEEIINKERKTLFSFSFSVDNRGQYVKNSMFVPFLMYVMKMMTENSRVNYEDLSTPFRSQLELFEEQAQTIFINGVTKESLIEIQQVYQQYFHRLDNDQLNYLGMEVTKADQEHTSKNFNSFYQDDLEQILKKGENKALGQFIEGKRIEERIKIDENQKYIEEILQPNNMPDGRWPSPVDHRLSLMQQVAVNQILKNDQKISSVNGPPGTGKTTLLKDIFANIVVERAKGMVQFNNPTECFKKVKTINLNGYPYPIYLLDSTLNKYSMVVASSNNGAVENISKDLPKMDEIIRPPGKSKFKDYDELYAKEAEDLSMYPSAAKDLLGDNSDTWGLFSGALGKSDNISKFGWKLYGSKNNGDAFLQQLEQDSKQVKLKDWEDAVKDFQNIFELVRQKKEELQKFSDDYKIIQASDMLLKELENQLPILEQDQMNIEDEKRHLEQQKRLTEQQIKTLPKQSLLQRILFKKNIKKIELEKELNVIISFLKEEEKKLYLKRKQLEETKGKVERVKEKLATFAEQVDYYKNQGLTLPEDGYWSNSKQSYERRQLNTIWLTDELNFTRGLLFLKAMKLHKLMLAFNFEAIKSTLRLLNNRKQLNLNDKDHRLYLKNIWKSVHLITPLVSTTFASFSSMYKGVEEDCIDYLFIDEAGQASPQQSAGAIWRSKRVIVVGDPIQIEPVVTIDETILGDIRKYSNVDDKYIGTGASVQTLADLANPYGTLNNYGQWIGTPLWVHRRCLDPMFTIANEIAYDNKMVLPPQKSRGKSAWFDCKGLAVNRQFVTEQGDLVADHIVELWEKASTPPDVYIISPFTAVKDGIKQVLKQRLKNMPISNEEIKDWLEKSVGTVHTFQGKEADIVYLVTGTDVNSDGAANWSCSKPNLLNVAVTRAKKEFYVIGDYQRFSKKPFYASIIKYIDEVKRDNRSALHL
ncbi:AAA domain-containing protein [Peribacillus sp. NPDC006672]|uniref:DEAD/DEAH box helicase n=1 Tax=Peribacillus sp. NPDC006672 TaxID=3390606 RepID=UPI003D01F25E